ncbi:NYN domain-containing protein [bacterium]|nr:NYN domain-containing protein [bacterium]
MTNIAFLIDGFNMYHSALNASRSSGGTSTKWLNYRSLCSSFLHHFSRDAVVSDIFYFTAYAYHLLYRDPDIVNRHKLYIKCLNSVGVIEIEGRYKRAEVKCKACGAIFKRNEEKETDIAIDVKLLELLFKNQSDVIVVVSGDSDLVPAIKAAKEIFPNSKIAAMFPFRRISDEIKIHVDMYFRLKPKHYFRNQFPDPVILSHGTQLFKPSSW